MDTESRYRITERLCGYAQAIASLEGVWWTSTASAALIESHNGDISAALIRSFQDFSFSTIHTIPVKPEGLRALDRFLDNFILQRPFNTEIPADSVIKQTRSNVVWHIIDYIDLITDDFSFPCYYWCECVNSLTGDNGRMYIFPIEEHFLAFYIFSKDMVHELK